MYQIKTLNKISHRGLDKLAKNKYAISDDCENPDGILLRSASMHEMELPANLKAIARAGAGVNNIPIDRCSEQGIVVFNTPGANANAVKEMVLAALLLSSRKIVQGIDWVKNTLKGQGEDILPQVEKGKSAFVGPEIKGKRLGVIGLGAIGVLVCNSAVALGMEVYGYDPYLSVNAAWNLSRNIIHANSLKEIFENCDYVTIHVPLTAETKGMINSESIRSMKNGVRLLNFSRDGLVEVPDLLEAIDAKKIACYVTDFPQEELIGHEGCICIPHLGASTPESEDNCAEMAAEELRDYLEKGIIRHSVNLPNAELEKCTAKRICIIHKNIPSMLSQISAVLSSNNVNIENMLNKSKKDYAYTMIDVDDEVEKSWVKQLGEIAGVIRINVV